MGSVPTTHWRFDGLETDPLTSHESSDGVVEKYD